MAGFVDYRMMPMARRPVARLMEVIDDHLGVRPIRIGGVKKQIGFLGPGVECERRRRIVGRRAHFGSPIVEYRGIHPQMIRQRQPSLAQYLQRFINLIANLQPA